jgi:hypothetical protein
MPSASKLVLPTRAMEFTMKESSFSRFVLMILAELLVYVGKKLEELLKVTS